MAAGAGLWQGHPGMVLSPCVPPPPQFRFVNFFLPQAEAEGGGAGRGAAGRAQPAGAHLS